MSENFPLPHLLQLGTGEEASFTAFGYGSYQIVWPYQNLENLDQNLKHNLMSKNLKLLRQALNYLQDGFYYCR